MLYAKGIYITDYLNIMKIHTYVGQQSMYFINIIQSQNNVNKKKFKAALPKLLSSKILNLVKCEK